MGKKNETHPSTELGLLFEYQVLILIFPIKAKCSKCAKPAA